MARAAAKRRLIGISGEIPRLDDSERTIVVKLSVQIPVEIGSDVGAGIREAIDCLLETGLVITTWLATYSSHGLNSGTPNAAKSLTLRVTSVRSLASAVAVTHPNWVTSTHKFARCTPIKRRAN
jgi:hypothetical protein